MFKALAARLVVLLEALLRLLIALLHRIKASLQVEQPLDVPTSEDRLDMFFSQSLTGVFFMMLDKPIAWHDAADKEALLDYAMAHQRITKANQAMLDQYGAQEAELLGLTPNDLYAHDLAYGRSVWRKFFDRGRLHVESCEQRMDGTPIFIESDYICLYDQQGRIIGHFGVQNDISERKWADEQLKHSERTYRAIFNAITDALFIHDATTGQILDVNDSMLEMFGYERTEVPGLSVEDLSTRVFPYTNEQANMLIQRAATGETLVFEWHNRKKNGECFYSENILKLVVIAGHERIMAIVRDISERKQAEEEQAKLHAQLAHAQKMDSVGRLAGGVAHDFNNKLSVILGYTEMALEQVDRTHPVFADLQEIQRAADRSTALTRQLLAFARKQVITPQILDLNETVEKMITMLQRLIGENIDLVWLPTANLAPIKMDPSQIDQILANLCVNARDAIADVGRVTIETDTVIFDHAYCAHHAEVTPGVYVLLAVSDNGHGMDEETLKHAFEPFFTTKAQGRGTGLGLATVYGVVRQNNGFVHVYSEPGRGSTFRVYLPQHQGELPSVAADTAKPTPVVYGNETILLVEDEPSILVMVTKMIESFGYVVLAAQNPSEAMGLAHAHPSPIDLLITDVIMPEMNGRDLAHKLMAEYPNMKHLFISGYTANFIAHHGVLDAGVHFIQKPFAITDLATKVREVLG
ncbi:hybrid sensor histidine kinase/response regulator [Candidatus Viridilinea mediisalina]|nr:PAS domain-containing sensor histidine kinase [Candidatus Viridilinea mediisalina]